MTKTVEQRRRAYRMLDVIEANPDKHDQGSWYSPADRPVTAERALSECGTTLCVAGWTVVLAGMTIYEGIYVAGNDRMVPAEAAELLGLDSEEADQLFYRAQDLAAVRKAVADIFGPRPCDTCPASRTCETGQYATVGGTA